MSDHHSQSEDTAPPLTAELLFRAYSQGFFPMAATRDSAHVDWYSPDPRSVLPLDGFICPRSLRQRIKQQRFEVRIDSAFPDVIKACASVRKGDSETWINDEIIQGFCELHEHGFTHCVEAWFDGRLVGGLYGMAIGGAFFGESMFHRPDLGGTDASKVCLAYLVEHLNNRGFQLLDTQIANPHMAQFGIIEIPREEYLYRLAHAIRLDTEF